jgi:hypothetical protein
VPLFSQPEGRLTPEVSDRIYLIVSRLRGKAPMVHSPVEFAKAVEAIGQGPSR